LSDAKDRENKATDSEESEAWAEVFAALDEAGVNDGFAVERDTRLAEGRPALDAFFAAKGGSTRK
jgi:hypothetical protein